MLIYKNISLNSFIKLKFQFALNETKQKQNIIII